MKQDSRAEKAINYHRLANEAEAEADRYRQQRDELVRQLRATDSRYWTYRRLGELLNCSWELARHIIKH